ncbi:anti-anti-sigma factor [Methanocalculus alkaliphilus]|uniref:STAS domain-containing protein n=1 Tax=Methanocalculus alkaliphilus TaxID=768730 RepID=UPI00209E1706|nr:STAS domain-containing protein [Methanocalculus alkaliphilus]MCP1714822.1 anti-anti-sigma factor [Methanocalculus alkaliphilus]
MEITPTEIQNIRFLKVSGRIDSSNAPDAEEKLRGYAEGGDGPVIIDGSELTYISSGGLRVLLTIEKGLAKEDRHIILCSLRPDVEKIFRLTGFSSIFSIHPSIDAAMAYLQG